MMRRAIVVGDATSTGGVVLAGPQTQATIGGAAMAVQGGQATCPACNSTGVIAKAGGSRRESVYGFLTVLEHDIVLCKCKTHPTLIANSNPPAHYEDREQSEGVADLASAKAEVREHYVNAGNDPRDIGLGYDQHFLVKGEQGRVYPNTPYRITLADGSFVQGMTDANGRTRKFFAQETEVLRVQVPFHD